MTLHPDRVRDTLKILFKMVEIEPQYKYQGIPVRDLLPYIADDLARAINKHPDKAEVILSWLADAIFWCRGDSDFMPDFEVELKIQ